MEKYLVSIGLVGVVDDGLEVSQDFTFGKNRPVVSSTTSNQSVKSILLEEVGADGWVRVRTEFTSMEDDDVSRAGLDIHPASPLCMCNHQNC